MAIRDIEVILVDIPTTRVHKLSFTTMQAQNAAIVRVRAEDGTQGLGEVSAIGGPAWGAESTETVKAIIDRYITPVIVGADPRDLEALVQRMNRAVNGNAFAKAAVEMALVDLAARSMDLPAWRMLGGRCRDAIPCAWALASGDAGRDAEEAEEAIAAGRHAVFKIKIGADAPEHDLARVSALARRLAGRGEVRVDVNQAWDRATAHRYVPRLTGAGVTVIEQPLCAADFEGMADLQRRTNAAIMADESVASPGDALRLAKAGGVDAVSLKVAKSGGLLTARRVATVAEAAGMVLYGGTMLEGAIGTAAAAHLFLTLPSMSLGCELFGPRLLTGSLARDTLRYADNAVQVPEGPGFGVTLDESALEQFRRDRDPIYLAAGE